MSATTPEPASEHDHVTVTSALVQPSALAAGVRDWSAIVGLPVSTMLYVAFAATVRPPVSVYEHVAVWLPTPNAPSGPVTALSVGATLSVPSCASVTEQP